MSIERIIRNQADLNLVAAEMRKLAAENPVRKKPEYPKDQAEYDEEFPNQVEMMKLSPPLTQLLYLEGYTFVSVTLTYDQYENVKRWHLSCLAWREGDNGQLTSNERVSDVAAMALANAFLGDKHKEIPCEGNVLVDVRHFETEMT